MSNTKNVAGQTAKANIKAGDPLPAQDQTSAVSGQTSAEDAMNARFAALEGRFADLDSREADLASREAALAPREREAERATLSRHADDTRFKERLSMDYYSPPNQLEVPTDTEYHYRWIAEWVNGNQTPRAVQERLREGYVRVMADDLPEDFIVDEDSFGDGYARTTGLILMRIPHERKALRDNYYAKLSHDRLNSANELQGVAGRDSVKEDRGSRSLTGSEAGRALKQMSTS